MKKMICILVVALSVSCGEDITDADVTADTDLQQSDAGQVDADGAVSEEPVVLINFDLESVPTECLAREDSLGISSKQQIISVDQLNSGPIPFSINYSEFVKGIEREGYAIAFKNPPFFWMRIEAPEDAPIKFLETTFLLYEDIEGELVKIGEQKNSAHPGGFAPPSALDFPDEFGIPTVSLLQGDYALEVQTGVGSAFQIAGRLNGSFYFVDLDCLE